MKSAERTIIASVTVLVCVGIVMVYSVSVPRFTDIRDSYFFLARHLVWVAIGVVGFCAMVRVPCERLEAGYRHIYAATLLLLVLVLIPGVGTLRNGARRWIRLNRYIGFQPSELAKLGLALFVAGFASRRWGRLHEFRRGFLPLAAAIGLVAGLILVEPDIGTAALVGCVGMTIALVAGMRLAHAAGAVMLGAPMLVYMLWRSPQKWERIIAFLDPWAHRQGAAYQLIQSLIALGSGGLAGRGLGASRQKLFFVPEAYTDQIFSLLGEELGMAGTVGVLALFGLLVWQGFRVACRAPNTFTSLLAFGLTFTLGFQVAFNVAVVTGSVPTKGLALPFISFGGSSLLCSMMAAGLLVSIARTCPEEEPSTAREEPGLLAGGPPVPGARDRQDDIRIPLPTDF